MRTIRYPTSVRWASTRPAVNLAGRRRSALLVTLDLAAMASAGAWPSRPHAAADVVALIRLMSPAVGVVAYIRWWSRRIERMTGGRGCANSDTPFPSGG